MAKLEGNKSAKGKGFDSNPENINKSGAPKGKRVSTILKELLEKDLSALGVVDAPEGMDGNKALALQLLTIAFHKDSNQRDKISAITQILDRIEGKATQQIEVKEVKDQPLFPDDKKT